ncbi:ROK family protein [Cellulomonas hominis]|uniref:Sugar kinase n=1 Tax=Cellulomonas hominis TaxID=156981 RepID=A0A511F7B3_9CELL|nr:ROK family protein [Cellulomonas hominis]MBB5474114.1 putative NBD/HSP70 family sugar kinase [Cellulomonas hominis]MBU5424124.1 ROK family protein [Cellulomonas hominis]GEL45093.1 sugar kinase [Cellulomonas hominis]
MRLGADPPVRRADASGPDEVRRANLSAVLRMLHVHGPATRSDIVAATGFNRSTVGALTSELGRVGLVRERPGVVRGKGRPSLVVEPVSTGVHVLAFDVTQSSVGAALVGLGGYILQIRRRLHGTSPQDVAGVVALVAGLAEEMLRRAAPGSVCLGLVVSVPGSVRQPDGLVRRSPSLHWYEVPLADLLRAATGGAYPVAVGNDGDLGVVAEHLRGAARGSRDVLYVRGEAGVGGGVVVDGELLKGAGGYAGEVGHIVVRPGGRVCSCGARGCWEAEVGDAAIIRAAGRDPRESEIEDVLSDVAVGNRRAVAGVRRTGEWVGTGLATLVNLFNPAVVVLGGTLGALYPTMEPALAETFARALGPIREQALLVRSELGSDAQLVGAAEVGFADVLEDPLGTLARRGAAGAAAGAALVPHPHLG